MHVTQHVCHWGPSQPTKASGRGPGSGQDPGPLRRPRLGRNRPPANGATKGRSKLRPAGADFPEFQSTLTFYDGFVPTSTETHKQAWLEIKLI
jgi:hypothetical protein